MKKKKVGVLLATVVIAGSLTGCMKPYDKPEIVEVSPSQTAFLIPLEGKTTDQAQMQSEDMLKKNMVAAKRVTIPHRWLQEGRMSDTGKYIPSVRLIIVERKPVTREWSADAGTGTTVKNEAIIAESKESIGFSVNVNCVAQIDEVNTAKFLYKYSGSCEEYVSSTMKKDTKTTNTESALSKIMDTEIRAKVQSKFTEECAKYSLEEVLMNKQKIMDVVRNDVTTYFAKNGITINTLGMAGEVTYLNKDVQASIDAKFKAIKAKEAAVENAAAMKTQSETLDKTIKLKEIELKEKEIANQLELIKKWNGVLPTYQGGNGVFQLPGVK